MHHLGGSTRITGRTGPDDPIPKHPGLAMEEEKSILLHWVRPGPGYEPLPFDDMILEVRNALVKEGTPSDLGLIDLGLKLYHSKLQVSPSPIASSALKFQDVLGAQP
ncbi:MAG: hypothetical protein IPI77_19670 [Saprospiraceae bacterium]|nr:hypothetical protein [Saprospiraceae bacterium]